MRGRISVAGLILGLVTLTFPFVAAAQADRSYQYDDFSVHYTVNKDASVRVQEDLTYSFQGEYHQGYRSLSHKGSDAITDVVLTDTATGKPLTYVSTRQDKNNPASWGTYTIYSQNGATDIEWYYDLKDTTHTWTLSYVLHGAVSFYGDHDEFYWNLFSGLNAPVAKAEAIVTLPEDDTVPSALWYVENEHQTAISRPDAHTFAFTAQEFSQGASATIVAGWQKGLVDKHAYYLDALRIYARELLPILLIFVSLLISWLYSRISEHVKKSVIVAEYGPPDALTPAMAAVIVHGGVTKKTWAATIVDLAIRGHVTIVDETTSSSKRPSSRLSYGFIATIVILIALTVVICVGTGMSNAVTGTILLLVIGVPLGCALFVFLAMKVFPMRSRSKYSIHSVPSVTDPLRAYEDTLYKGLFPEGKSVFTMRSQSSSRQNTLHAEASKAEQELYDEMQTEHQFYRISPAWSRRWWSAMHVLWIVFVLAFTFFSGNVSAAIPSGLLTSHTLFLAGSILVSLFILIYSFFFRANLNAAGEAVRNKVLSFKLYLETAERYRLQNLTPDMFQKYLPYAMVFGVEKKWAATFANIGVESPTWYVVTAPGAVPGTFSPEAFSTGFSASFSTSLSSSGTGGAISGGGFAGGGGGGGGGGAS